MKEHPIGLDVSDGYITRMVFEKAELRVFVVNWQEEIELIIFVDAIGVQAVSVENVDLSHVTEQQDDPFVKLACEVGEEDCDKYRCYSFYSAWTDEAILRVVAQRFVVAARRDHESR